MAPGRTFVYVERLRWSGLRPLASASSWLPQNFSAVTVDGIS
jgi:hypothetical protein